MFKLIHTFTYSLHVLQCDGGAHCNIDAKMIYYAAPIQSILFIRCYDIWYILSASLTPHKRLYPPPSTQSVLHMCNSDENEVRDFNHQLQEDEIDAENAEGSRCTSPRWHFTWQDLYIYHDSANVHKVAYKSNKIDVKLNLNSESNKTISVANVVEWSNHRHDSAKLLSSWIITWDFEFFPFVVLSYLNLISVLLHDCSGPQRQNLRPGSWRVQVSHPFVPFCVNAAGPHWQ